MNSDGTPRTHTPRRRMLIDEANNEIHYLEDGREVFPVPKPPPRKKKKRPGFKGEPKNTCEWCGKYCITERHHIIKRSQGGTDEPDNRVDLCTECHMEAHGIKVVR